MKPSRYLTTILKNRPKNLSGCCSALGQRETTLGNTGTEERESNPASRRQPGLKQAIHKMLKVGWDFEWEFAGEHAHRKVRFLLKGLRRVFLRAIKFSHMGMGGCHASTRIEWHGLGS